MNQLFRHFYEYESPRPPEEIDKGICRLDKEILAMLREVV
jgi:hypothetical protein